ncbi:subtilisin-like protein [Venturia nashicola]|uniref:Subtilisin-like protein n=1 Tax=Venturia nashicola TaxID=86259 RepID=A0A4Z1NNH0_9PEZI|nr:subtilisin-like protein [Venturia nashicola]
MKLFSVTAAIVLTLCSVVNSSPFAPGDQTLNTHASGGETYIVLFNRSHPSVASVSDVLSRVDLHPEHEDVHMVWDGLHMRGFCANMKSHCIDALNGMDDIAVVEKSRTISVARKQTQMGAPWGLARISTTGDITGSSVGLNYTYSWNSATTKAAPGAGADIYLIDTGINTEHAAFGGRAKMIWPDSTVDGFGHGTHTAGTAGAAKFGVAFGANLLGLKALDDRGIGQTPKMIDAINFARDTHTARSKKPGFVGSVMSLSLSMTRENGYLNVTTAMEFALNTALDAGMHVVVASGNDGSDSCLTDPASSGGANGRAISVGSIGMKNVVSLFSNTGACTDIYAPGEDIVSTWIGGDSVINPDNGTSMATPHVSGIIAYLMVQKPELAKDPIAMKKYLLDTSLKNVIKYDPRLGAPPLNDAFLMVNNGIVGDGFISRS